MKRMEPDIARLAASIAVPARATMLLALMDGRSLPSGELAFTANVAPQTASGHLAKLVEAGLLKVEVTGRHRYYRIASDQISSTIEALGEIAPPRRPPEPESEAARAFRFARSCYRHLAGVLAVRIVSSLEREKLVRPTTERHCQLTEPGRQRLEDLGVEIPRSRLQSDGVGRYCLDWTERRYHLSGPLGRIILTRFCEMGWLKKIRDTRALRLTVNGQIELNKRLRLGS